MLAEWFATEQPGIINDLAMNAAQIRLARAIHATGKPVVLALFERRPRIIRSAVDSARAIVTGYQTGPFGGEALASVLYGDVNPSGKLRTLIQSTRARSSSTTTPDRLAPPATNGRSVSRRDGRSAMDSRTRCSPTPICDSVSRRPACVTP